MTNAIEQLCIQSTTALSFISAVVQGGERTVVAENLRRAIADVRAEVGKCKEEVFVISWRGSPLVIVDGAENVSPSDILMWYAEKYAFKYADLTWSGIPSVNYEKGECPQ